MARAATKRAAENAAAFKSSKDETTESPEFRYCPGGSPRTDPQPTYVLFLIGIVLICGAYYKTVLENRASLDVDGVVALAAEACPRGCNRRSGPSGSDMPRTNVFIYATVASSGAVDDQFAAGASAPLREVVRRLESAGSETAAAGGQMQADFLVRRKGFADLSQFVPKGKVGEGAAALSDAAVGVVLERASSALRESFNGLDAAGLWLHEVIYIGVPESMAPKVRCLRAPDGAAGTVSGCVVPLVNGTISADTAASLKKAGAALVAKSIGLHGYDPANLAAWVAGERERACCVTLHSLGLLKQLLESISSMPVPESVLSTVGALDDALRSNNVIRAGLLAHELVNSPQLTPQLILPFEHQLAIHLPVFLPLLMTAVTGIAHIKRYRQQQSAKKKTD